MTNDRLPETNVIVWLVRSSLCNLNRKWHFYMCPKVRKQVLRYLNTRENILLGKRDKSISVALIYILKLSTVHLSIHFQWLSDLCTTFTFMVYNSFNTLKPLIPVTSRIVKSVHLGVAFPSESQLQTKGHRWMCNIEY